MRVSRGRPPGRGGRRRAPRDQGRAPGDRPDEWPVSDYGCAPDGGPEAGGGDEGPEAGGGDDGEDCSGGDPGEVGGDGFPGDWGGVEEDSGDGGEVSGDGEAGEEGFVGGDEGEDGAVEVAGQPGDCPEAPGGHGGREPEGGGSTVAVAGGQGLAGGGAGRSWRPVSPGVRANQSWWRRSKTTKFLTVFGEGVTTTTFCGRYDGHFPPT